LSLAKYLALNRPLASLRAKQYVQLSRQPVMGFQL
jgi:hypothetical protein